MDYYFLSHGEFMQAVTENRFVEWEEVYKGTCYGTLRSEVERIWAKGHVIVFDVDVVGGINLKRIFGDDACSVFIMPPSVEELRRRLEGRGTDAPEVIDRQGRIRTDESPRVRPRGGQRLPRRGRVRHVQHPRPIHRTVG